MSCQYQPHLSPNVGTGIGPYQFQSHCLTILVQELVLTTLVIHELVKCRNWFDTTIGALIGSILAAP